MDECEKIVIISYSRPALGFAPHWKRVWLEHFYPSAIIITPSEVPHNDDSEWIHRSFCAELCEREDVRPNMVYTSEPWGDYFAQFLSERWEIEVKHTQVDILRQTIPISGTALRDNPHLWQNFVHPFVQKNHTRRLVLLGGESSGKTTLAKKLSEATGHPWIPEYGRTHCEILGGVANLMLPDMQLIGMIQTNMEEVVINHSSFHWIICDTSPLTTAFYSEELFGQVDERLQELAKRKYDLTVLLSLENWQQDGDRFSPEFSQKQEAWYVNHLTKNQIDFVRIGGSIDQRVNQLKQLLENYHDRNDASDHARGTDHN